jgi:hypothetical protein
MSWNVSYSQKLPQQLAQIRRASCKGDGDNGGERAYYKATRRDMNEVTSGYHEAHCSLPLEPAERLVSYPIRVICTTRRNPIFVLLEARRWKDCLPRSHTSSRSVIILQPGGIWPSRCENAPGNRIIQFALLQRRLNEAWESIAMTTRAGVARPRSKLAAADRLRKGCSSAVLPLNYPRSPILDH